MDLEADRKVIETNRKRYTTHQDAVSHPKQPCEMSTGTTGTTVTIPKVAFCLLLYVAFFCANTTDSASSWKTSFMIFGTRLSQQALSSVKRSSIFQVKQVLGPALQL